VVMMVAVSLVGQLYSSHGHMACNDVMMVAVVMNLVVNFYALLDASVSINHCVLFSELVPLELD